MRIKSLACRLQNDRPFLEKYDGVIQDQVTKGITEKVDENEVQGTRLHSLTHQPVLTPSKTTTKLRIVYDASSKSKRGTLSLNDCLHRGPTLLPSLCGVLMRYRTYPIAILADIEKAFLQFTVQRHDRDVTRFLWFRDYTRPCVHQNLDTYRFCRVPFGVVSSPFLLQGTLQHHLQAQSTELAKHIADNIYVDNISIGATSIPEGVQMYTQAKAIFRSAGMN